MPLREIAISCEAFVQPLYLCRLLTEDSQYFSREEMISLLLVWTRTRPIFALFSPLLTRRAKTRSLNQKFVTASAQFRHPEKPGHVSFRIRILGSARQGETRVPLQYQRSARGARNGRDVMHGYIWYQEVQF